MSIFNIILRGTHQMVEFHVVEDEDIVESSWGAIN